MRRILASNIVGRIGKARITLGLTYVAVGMIIMWGALPLEVAAEVWSLSLENSLKDGLSIQIALLGFSIMFVGGICLFPYWSTLYLPYRKRIKEGRA